MFTVPCLAPSGPPRLAVALPADDAAALAAGLARAAESGAVALVLAGAPPPDIRARIGDRSLVLSLDGAGAPLPPVAPDAVLLRDARSGRDVVALGARLAVHEAERGWPDGGLPIVAEIGHPLGLLEVRTFVGASPRLAGLGLDAAALAAALRAEPEGEPLAQARALVRLAAGAAGVAAFARLGGDGIASALAAARREGIGWLILPDPGAEAALRAAP